MLLRILIGVHVAAGLTAAAVGYTARRIRWHGWLPHHITGMALSYTAMLTAFYVDNGPRLPVWKLLPPAAFWFLPTAIGLPPLIRALHHHSATPSRGPNPPSPPRSSGLDRCRRRRVRPAERAESARDDVAERCADDHSHHQPRGPAEHE
jgi:hypothetical protein